MKDLSAPARFRWLPPGLRPEYNPTYYAAFILDPDGNRIEAVCREPGE